MLSEVTAEPFQMSFLESKKRYPALVAGVGTGKTMFLLLKIWQYCSEYENSLALIVRKEFTDLRDSTIKDFQEYFDCKIDGNKEYHFPNGSCIMFRHGSEIEVLKNVNLSIFGIEQSEEFDSEETFTFLRDRLRRSNAPYQQGIIIANTNGHNWIWRLWKNNPSTEDFHLIEATTFDNPNLPKDFLEDRRRLEKEAPHHYARYVMNSWEETDDGDLLIPFHYIEQAVGKKFVEEGGKVLGCDIARFGDDKTVFTILQRADGGWKMIYLTSIRGQDLMQTVGQIVELRRTYGVHYVVVDDCGLGGGVTDRLMELEFKAVMGFNASNKAIDNERFYNRRAECYHQLKELFQNGKIQILNDEELKTQLASTRFYYKNAKTIIESKEDMKERGLRSPDKADALMMCMHMLDQTGAIKNDESYSFKPYAPQHYKFNPSSYNRKPAFA